MKRIPSLFVSLACALCSTLALAVTEVPLQGVASISTGTLHSCARMANGSLKCWGNGFNGQIGDNGDISRCPQGFTCADVASRHYPVDVPEQSDGIAKVAAGNHHTCALAANGTVKCWGLNLSGEIGNGSGAVEHAAPEAVNGISTAVDLSVGYAHSCAALASPGTVACWGSNIARQLGDGTGTNRDTPGIVQGLVGAYKAVAAGTDHSCALASAGDAVRCWGSNSSGQTGGTSVLSTELFDVVGLPASGIQAIAAGGYHTCALAGGKVYCWGDGRKGQIGNLAADPFFNAAAVQVTGITNATAIVAGNEHTCALEGGAMKCWGSNANGNLGDGTTTNRSTPVTVSGLASGVDAISQRCAVVGTDNGVKCWGSGIIGDGLDQTAGNRLTPVNVVVVTDYTAEPFSFSPSMATGVQAGSTQQSSFTTPSGFDDVALVTIVNGEYSQQCSGPFTSRPGNLPIGRGICVRHTASTTAGDMVTTTLTVGGQSATFSSTTTGTASFEQKVINVVSSYYQTILGRPADTAGLNFWAGEANRVSQLGADVREAFFAMAMEFFSGGEYAARNRTDDQFVTDLYQTFFSRTPLDTERAYWVGELAIVQSRSALLNIFLFSTEFTNTMTGLFSASNARPEVNLTMDLFRGVFGRLPDSTGFTFYLGQLRTAQCQGASAVSAKVGELADSFFGSPEYSGRSRGNRDFVSDVYNTYLRRGPNGDAAGFNFWVSELTTRGRDGVRAEFVPSPEFQNRVAAVVAAGCSP